MVHESIPQRSMMHESHEDYWEDASVSLGCNLEWGLAFSSLCQIQEGADGCEKAVNAPKACQSNAYAHSADHAAASSAKRLHSFPPPISFCVTLSIKEGGRFVLKETDARLPLQSCFRAERMNGRLCLHLVEPEQLDGDPCDESKLSVAKYLDGGVHDPYMAAYEDTATHDCGYKLIKDDIVGDVKDMCGSNVCDKDVNMEQVEELKSVMNDATHDVYVVDDVEDKSENDSVYAASPQRDGSDSSTLVNYEEKQEALKSRSNEKASIGPTGIPSEVLLTMERCPLWGVNDMAAHIQSWPPNELLLHGSFANMSPSLGLTVS